MRRKILGGEIGRLWLLMMAVVSFFSMALAPVRIAAQAGSVFPVEFSADLVTTTNNDATPPMTGKVYVSKARIRVDTNSDGTGIGQIVNLEKKESWWIFYKIKTAEDLSATTVEFDSFPGVPKPSFYSTKPFDPEHNCRTVSTVTTCEKLGMETLNGRESQKMVIKDTIGATETTWLMWVDLTLDYPLKVQSNGTIVELKNIKLGPQPDSVFEIPADFKRTVLSIKSNLVMPPVKH